MGFERLLNDSFDGAWEELGVVEGAAAVAMAGLLRLAPRLAGKNVAAAMCGNNIGADLLVETMAQHGSGSGAPGRL